MELTRAQLDLAEQYRTFNVAGNYWAISLVSEWNRKIAEKEATIDDMCAALKEQYEYLTSDEGVLESLAANGITEHHKIAGPWHNQLTS